MPSKPRRAQIQLFLPEFEPPKAADSGTETSPPALSLISSTEKPKRAPRKPAEKAKRLLSSQPPEETTEPSLNPPTPALIPQEVIALPATESAPALPLPPSPAVSPASDEPVAAPHPGKTLPTWSLWLLIVASLALFLALGSAIHEFTKTQAVQRDVLVSQQNAIERDNAEKMAALQSRAVDLLLRYNELANQLTVNPQKNAKKDNRYWKEALAIHLLESLYNLTRGLPDWENTILWSLEKHQRFIREQRLNCSNYSPAFITLLEKSTGNRSTTLCRDNP